MSKSIFQNRYVSRLSEYVHKYVASRLP